MATAATATPTNSLSTIAQTNLPPPPPLEPEQYTISDLALAALKEKAKDAAKIGSYTAFWLTEAIPGLPREVTKFNHTLRDFKNFVSVTEVPEKVHNVVKAVKEFANSTADKVAKAARNVFKETMSFINAIGDTIDFAHVFVPISKAVMRWVSGINFAATIGGSANGAIEQVQKIHGLKSIDTKKTQLYLINLARDISYLVLGIIGLTFVLTGTPFVAWMIVACLTSGLTFSLGSYFYERIADPEDTGKNLNPAIVIKNKIAQRDYRRKLAAASGLAAAPVA
jgi:hypothetical protein